MLHDHTFRQRNKTTKRAGDGEGGLGKTWKKGVGNIEGSS